MKRKCQIKISERTRFGGPPINTIDISVFDEHKEDVDILCGGSFQHGLKIEHVGNVSTEINTKNGSLDGTIKALQSIINALKTFSKEQNK